MSFKWHQYQSQCLQSNHKIVIAKDISDKGHKNYAAFDTLEKFQKHLETIINNGDPKEQCLYELIKPNQVCKFKLDIDIKAGNHAKIEGACFEKAEIDRFTCLNKKVWDKALKEYFDSLGKPTPKHLFVYSHTPQKWSCHVSVLVNIDDWATTGKGMAFGVKETIMSWNDPEAARIADNIDMSVYSKNRLFRIPFNKKLKQGAVVALPHGEDGLPLSTNDYLKVWSDYSPAIPIDNLAPLSISPPCKLSTSV